MPQSSAPESPRLQQLLNELRNGKTDALESFWSDVKKAGIPLVEPVEITRKNDDGEEETVIDEKNIWVTFLYEGDETTENVALMTGFMYKRMSQDGKPDPSKLLINHLENLNIWYWTQKLPGDFRTQYFLPPNHPLTSPQELDTKEKRKEFEQKVLIPDPLNPKRIVLGADPTNPESTEITLSVFEGPHAKSSPYVNERENIPKGTVTNALYKSAIFEDECHNWVYTPPGFDPERAEAYPFLLLFDGYIYIDLVKTPVILDNLIAEGKIPPTVCLCMGNFEEKRNKILPPNDQMPQALAEEIIPHMRERYHITDDPQQTIIGGSSYGGLAAAWNAFIHPEIFGNVLSQSGSYWWAKGLAGEESDDSDDNEPGWLIRQYINSEKRSINFYLDAGKHEISDFSKTGASQLSMNRHMRDVLTAKGYTLHYAEYPGDHDYCWWLHTLADGLLALHEMMNNSL